ncbi:MAG: hypothetical protein HOP29_13650 [Phycisphaerales bacterium]|nr:hypothetical protein [Phycisphaerales bacterium]
MKVRLIPCLTAVLVWSVSAAVAQPSERKSEPFPPDKVEPAKARAEVEGFWPVDALTEQAVKRIAFRYNLNEEQTEYTREMMNTRVKKFLDDHQDDIWPLIRDLAYYQRQGHLPDSPTAQKLAPVALNILREARDEIFRSNEEWGDVLTPDQKRVHDYDMKEMQRTFEMMNGNFEKWKTGDLAEGTIFPAAKRLVDDPPRPSKPDGAALGEHARDPQGLLLDSHFDAYVEKFIRDYQLTPPQQEAARSILREIKKRSADFRDTHHEELTAIKDELAKSDTPEKRREINERRRKVTAPLDDLFQEFKTRLDQIPDQAQKERYEAENWRSLPKATTRRAKAEKSDANAPAGDAKQAPAGPAPAGDAKQAPAGAAPGTPAPSNAQPGAAPPNPQSPPAQGKPNEAQAQPAGGQAKPTDPAKPKEQPKSGEPKKPD